VRHNWHQQVIKYFKGLGYIVEKQIYYYTVLKAPGIGRLRYYIGKGGSVRFNYEGGLKGSVGATKGYHRLVEYWEGQQS